MNINNLSDYGGKMFKENDDKPYTGLVFDLYRTTGNKSLEGRYKDGLRNGKWSWWNEDNKMDSSGTYKDGNQDRKWTYWYENGQKSSAGPYKDGKEDGLWTYYTEVGNGKYEVTYKAGIYTTAVFTDSLGIDYTGSPITDEPEQDGIFLFQEDEGGEYDFSHFPLVFATIKDDERGGLWTEWYTNGQKKEEGTYKDGELISEQCWDEGGNETACGI